jgi:regulator of protease activity HflC (stomatin/prohibitin superfamily)
MFDDHPFLCIAGILAFISAVILGSMWAYPKWKVYSQEKDGEAEYAKAEQNRRVTVLEAQAKQEAAKALAQAEIERAKGIAEANRIVGESLKGNDEYLRYLWIDKVAGAAQREVVYVPTEASLPILESTRLRQPAEAH